MECYYINKKNVEKYNFKVACVFPEKYFYGICNLGHQIIYNSINSYQQFFADRVYQPNNCNYKALSIEKKWELNKFDYIFVTLSFETNIVNFIGMLISSNIPVFSKDRDNTKFPLIIAGGLYATYNPEPYADFFDIIHIGEIEENIDILLNTIYNYNNKKLIKEKLEGIRGFYIPEFKNKFPYNCDYKIRQAKPVDINRYPAHTIVSSDNSAYRSHSFSIELSRGCNKKCRFCLQRHMYLPQRIVNKNSFKELLNLPKNKTKYIKLFYEGLPPDVTIKYFDDIIKNGFNLRVGSQRLETTSKEVINYIIESGQPKITFAPETSNNLRSVIGKPTFSDSLLYEMIEYSLKKGVSKIGLYFIVGLPKEDKNDHLKICKIIDNSFEMIKLYTRNKGNLIIGINPLYPKPGTPFQYVDYIYPKESKRIFSYIKENLKNKESTVISTDIVNENIMPSRGNYRMYSMMSSKIIFETSINSTLCEIQPLLSRGGREVEELILYVGKYGNTLNNWFNGLKDLNIDIKNYYSINSNRAPWYFIEYNTSKKFLDSEYNRTVDYKK